MYHFSVFKLFFIIFLFFFFTYKFTVLNVSTMPVKPVLLPLLFILKVMFPVFIVRQQCCWYYQYNCYNKIFKILMSFILCWMGMYPRRHQALGLISSIVKLDSLSHTSPKHLAPRRWRWKDDWVQGHTWLQVIWAPPVTRDWILKKGTQQTKGFLICLGDTKHICVFIKNIMHTRPRTNESVHALIYTT